MKSSKKLDMHYKPLGTEFYTTCNPDEVEAKLALILKRDEIEPKICPKKYKVTFTKDEVKFKVQILQCKNDTYAIEFSRLSGNKETFLELYRDFKNDPERLEYFNDAVLQ